MLPTSALGSVKTILIELEVLGLDVP